MQRNQIRVLFVVIGITTIISTLGQGCQGPGGTSTGNPMKPVSLSFDAYDPNAKVSRVTTQSVSGLQMCFKRLRLKVDSATGGDNIDLNLGLVSINPSGTDLSEVDLPIGTYTRIEFDLNDDCMNGKSVVITNSHGTFSTDDGMTIVFEGSVTIGEDNQNLALAIQQIVSALGTVTQNSGIRSAAESVEGSF